MNTEQLDAIQARADAATEGPWDVHQEIMRVGGEEFEALSVVRLIKKPRVTEVNYVAPMVNESADQDFIAAARTDVPALLAYARDLEARIGRVEAACDRVINNEDGHKPPGPPHPTREQATAALIRAALTATEGA